MGFFDFLNEPEPTEREKDALKKAAEYFMAIRSGEVSVYAVKISIRAYLLSIDFSLDEADYAISKLI